LALIREKQKGGARIPKMSGVETGNKTVSMRENMVTCPNCEKVFESGGICPKCKIDVALFSKTLRISDSLYNAGLAKVQSDDMTGAIDSLNKSLTLTKKNVAARNLLGLVYFEIGRIGDAYKEWYLSMSLESEGNSAADYLKQMGNNSRQLEKLNDAILMYNKALDYIRQKSDDMAIIQLKKAIDINPSFIDALNLLTLCYMMQNENEKALTIIEKTLTIDVNNTVALYYYKQMFPGKARPELGRPQKGRKAPAAPIIKTSAPAEAGMGRSFHIPGILGFIVGGLAAYAFLFMLIMPGRLAVMEDEIEAVHNQRIEEAAEYQSRIDEANTKITTMEENEESLQERIVTLDAQITLNEHINRIVDAERHLDREEFQEAFDLAGNISTYGLPSDLIERVQAIMDTASPRLLQIYHNSGVYLYLRFEFERSRIEFHNALRFMPPGHELGGDIYYHLGRIAVQQGYIDAARQYFQTVLELYPYGNRANDAALRLDWLG